MKAKEYLLQIRAMSVRIENKQDRIRLINDRLTSPAVQSIQDVKVKESPATDKLERLAVKKTQLETELQELIIDYTAFVLKVGKDIDSLDNPLYARLLHLRYVEGKSLSTISDLLEYEYGYIRKKHGAALQAYAVKCLT